MKLLATIKVPDQPRKRIELLQGDLTDPGPGHPFDLLVISAFPDNYMPTRSSLIGALHAKGLSVAALAGAKALDLRTHFSCWLSGPIAMPGMPFRRLLCFEPLVRGSAPEVVADIFRALMPVLGDFPDLKTAAMPIVAAGNQAWPVDAIMPPLLEAAVQWMKIGLPLDVVKLVVFSDADVAAAEAAVKAFQPPAVRPAPARTPDAASFDHDVFLSYAREDASSVTALESLLIERSPGIRIFLDRKSIAIGSAWQPEIFEAIDRCRKVVAVLSPAYLASKVCKEEFNIAWARSRKTDLGILFPIYLQEAPLPTYMTYRSYVDCRGGGAGKLVEACTALLESL